MVALLPKLRKRLDRPLQRSAVRRRQADATSPGDVRLTVLIFSLLADTDLADDRIVEHAVALQFEDRINHDPGIAAVVEGDRTAGALEIHVLTGEDGVDASLERLVVALRAGCAW